MEVDTKPFPSPIRSEDPDPRQSLQHVLTASNGAVETPPRHTRQDGARKISSASNSRSKAREATKDHAEEERSVQSDSYSRAADINPSYTMTVVHSRRNANGTIGSVYSGNKIRHLKKEDGVPLWRKDIQFSFLQAVFDDRTPVFTATDGTPGHSFADIYIHAMAKSSKTSKILNQKLLTERESALNMAMICLLVNVGRMNTTLNFFPEMRAQLRTYHSIPCLQAHQDPNAYKQLQDAPRLKSILKGACEDSEQPNSIEKIQAAPIPRTNPVNLIFVLSQYAPKISETHFFQPRDFFDLVIRSTLSSRSRAKAFLWLIWWYLESDFSEKDALNNPFGPGIPGDEPNSMPIKVPAFEHLTEEQASAENVDTEEEIAYGEMKRLERKRILEEDETVGPPMKKTATRHVETADDRRAGSTGRSEVDHTRSPSPSQQPPLFLPKPSRNSDARKLTGYRNENHSGMRSDFDKQPSSRLILKTSRLDRGPESSSPAPPGSGYSTFRTQSSNTRRSRPETSHQKAVNRNRQLRIDNIIHKKLVAAQKIVRRRKAQIMKPPGYKAMSRIIDLPDDYDSEDELSHGPGGLAPNRDEEQDYGGEALMHKKVLDRVLRRLAREDGDGKIREAPPSQSVPSRKRKFEEYDRSPAVNGQTVTKSRKSASNGFLHSSPAIERGSKEDVLDDLDLDLLGEDRDDDHAEDESDEEREEDSGPLSPGASYLEERDKWEYEDQMDEN